MRARETALAGRTEYAGRERAGRCRVQALESLAGTLRALGAKRGSKGASTEIPVSCSPSSSIPAAPRRLYPDPDPDLPVSSICPTFAMLLYLHNALALIQGTSTSPEEVSQPSMLFPMLAMGAIFYFVLIAPERKTRKARKAMLDTVKKGDKVMTTGGIFGTVRKVEEHKIHLIIDDKVCMCSRARQSRASWMRKASC